MVGWISVKCNAEHLSCIVKTVGWISGGQNSGQLHSIQLSRYLRHIYNIYKHHYDLQYIYKEQEYLQYLQRSL